MNKGIWKKLIATVMLIALVVTGINVNSGKTFAKMPTGITVHYKGTDQTPNIYYWNVDGGQNNPIRWPGTAMNSESDNWYSYTFEDAQSIELIFIQNGTQSKDLSRTTGEWWYKDNKWYSSNPELEEETGASIILHFKSPWDGAKLYYWDTNPGEKSLKWPGDNMETEGDGWYKYTIKNAWSANIIFNFNGQQTADLTRVKGEWWFKDNKWYAYNPDAPTEESIVIHFKSPWDGAKIHYWATEPTAMTTTWPGRDMIEEGNGWYKFTFANTNFAKIVFNYNGRQSADLTRTSGEWWLVDNVWHNKNPEEPETTPEETTTEKPTTPETTTEKPTTEPTTPEPTTEETTTEEPTTQEPTTEETTTEEVTTEEPTTPEPTTEEPTTEEPTTQEPTTEEPTTEPTTEDKKESIIVHFKSSWNGAKIHYWNTLPTISSSTWPGKDMESEGDGWYKYTFTNTTSVNIVFNYGGQQTGDLNRKSGEWWYKGSKWYSYNPDNQEETTEQPTTDEGENPEKPEPGEPKGIDFRDETIYFLMVTRFYDGDSSNNVHCWDEVAAMKESGDAAWRGDFKGLIEKLDYIKALGFSAVWITPIVKNISGYDYHGYHASNHSVVDPRYESSDTTYQDLIDAAHEKDMKIIQDIVLNHTGNFGEENIFPLFTKDDTKEDTIDALVKIDEGKLPDNYDELQPAQQYAARINAMKEDDQDINNIYHHEKSLSWEGYTVQTGQIAGDCVDLNTENPVVTDYLIDCYTKYINMGVDAFRIDTVKHISRLTFNNEFIPSFKAAGGSDFYMFGEVATRYRQVWNNNIPAISTPFYTWAETKHYLWNNLARRTESVYQHWMDNQNVGEQPTSTNHLLMGNTYHKPDDSIRSGLDVIDFPMHWNFNNASDAFHVGVDGDKYYSDATWNVTYVDSHDYAPDCAPENQRFAGSQDTWAENLNLMYTFRGIPCIYYGSEIEFMKGAPIDVGPARPLNETGRAYFGDHIEGSVNVTDFGEYTNATGAMAETLNHPLSKHIQRLNRIRRAIPALRKGQYSTEGIFGNMAYKRRYTDAENNIDSFVLVSVTDGATFTGIPNGRYVDAITGDVKVVSNGTLTTPSVGKGNMRVYVLDLPGNPAPGKVGTSGTYLK